MKALRSIEEAAAKRGDTVWNLCETCKEMPSSGSSGADQLKRDALGGSPKAELCDRGALFLSDTCTQMHNATVAIHSLRSTQFVGRAAKPHGHFLLFVDEADAMQRTDGDINEPIKLERRLTTLCGGVQREDGVWVKLGDGPDNTAVQLDETFWGPHAVVAISATLLPVFLRGRRDAKKCRAAALARGVQNWQPAMMHPFYTTEKMSNYMGVDSPLWKPFRIDEAPVLKAAADAAAAEAAAADQAPPAVLGKGGELFLKKGGIKNKTQGLDEDGMVLALYQHAYERKLSLLLDVTITRVTKGFTVRAPGGGDACSRAPSARRCA